MIFNIVVQFLGEQQDNVVKTLGKIQMSDVFKQEFAGLLIGAFNITTNHLNVKTVEVFKKFEFNDMDVFDLKKYAGDDLTIKSGIIFFFHYSDLMQLFIKG